MNARHQIRVRMEAAAKTREEGQHASVPRHTPEIPVRMVKRMHLFEVFLSTHDCSMKKSSCTKK